VSRRALTAAILMAAALAPGTARAAAADWTTDVEASQVGFTARQMEVQVPGRFRRFTAVIRFAADDLASSSATIVIEVGSVETPSQDIEVEIKREPWLDIARFPTARFETTAIEHLGGDRYDAQGTLTLRGVSRPVTLPLTIAIADDPDKPGMLRARAAGEVTVSRLAYGIGQGQWQATAVVPDEVVIRIDLVARRPKP